MGYLVLFIALGSWMLYGLAKHNHNNSYVSDRWTERHIDSNGNYRA